MVQPCSHGLAPSPQGCPDLLETTAGVRQGGSPARKEMARKIQCAGTPVMGWTPVREGQYTGDELEPGTYLSGDLGECPVPVHLRAGTRFLGLTAVDARVVFSDCDLYCSLGSWPLLETVVVVPAVARVCGGRPPGASRPQCPAGVFC